jgi:hypothetical protein
MNGVYTFGVGEQLTWAGSCYGMPFVTITGGHGRFQGAVGFVWLDNPGPKGDVHKITLCKGAETPTGWDQSGAVASG